MYTSLSEVTHVCLLDIDSTASRSRHGSLLCPDPQAKQSVSLPIRSVHIKPSPVETDTTDMLLGLPRGKPRNPVNRKLTTRRHGPQLALENLPRAASNSSLPDRLLGPCAAQAALLSTDLLNLRIWWSYDVVRASTRHLGFWHLLHTPVDLARAETLLLTSSDVT